MPEYDHSANFGNHAVEDHHRPPLIRPSTRRSTLVLVRSTFFDESGAVALLAIRSS